MRKLTVAAAALALAIAGCGSDEEKADADDQAIVDEAVLTINDLPSGWGAQESTTTEDKASRQAVADCVGVDYSALYDDSSATANSDNFLSADEIELTSSVKLGASEEWMSASFEVASSKEFRDCAVQAVAEDMSGAALAGAEVGEIVADDLPVGQLGDDRAAFRIVVPIVEDEAAYEFVLDFVVVRVGRGQVMASTFSASTSIEVDELAGFAKISADRLQAALDAS